MKKVLILLLTVLGICACAGRPSVTEYQCKAGDWQTVGYRDGSSGLRNTQLLAHQEACGEFGIIPDRESYLAGWRDGLVEYCTPENGFYLGERGSRHNAVCRGELQQPFLSAYEDGRLLYSARREVNSLAQQLAAYEDRLLQIKQDMVSVSTAQLNPDLTPEERLHLVADLDSLVEERSDIRHAIPALERELAESERSLDRLSRDLAGASYRR